MSTEAATWTAGPAADTTIDESPGFEVAMAPSRPMLAATVLLPTCPVLWGTTHVGDVAGELGRGGGADYFVDGGEARSR